MPNFRQSGLYSKLLGQFVLERRRWIAPYQLHRKHPLQDRQTIMHQRMPPYRTGSSLLDCVRAHWRCRQQPLPQQMRGQDPMLNALPLETLPIARRTQRKLTLPTKNAACYSFVPLLGLIIMIIFCQTNSHQ